MPTIGAPRLKPALGGPQPTRSPLKLPPAGDDDARMSLTFRPDRLSIISDGQQFHGMVFAAAPGQLSQYLPVAITAAAMSLEVSIASTSRRYPFGAFQAAASS